MARTDPQVNIRMSQELKDALELSASASSRTLTAEIIHRLSTSFASRSSENADALASGMATGMLKGITDAAPHEVAAYLEPIVERINERARAYFEDPRTSEAIYERLRKEVQQARENEKGKSKRALEKDLKKKR